MPDIFDEVQEDLRAERARRLLTRYGFLLVAAAVLVVAGVAGWQGWKYYRVRDADRAARAYLAVTDRLDVPDSSADRVQAIAGLAAVAKDSGPGYRALARLREAALLADTGDRTGALALWDGLALDTGVDPLLRDLAALYWCRHQIDAGDANALQGRLARLAGADQPFHGLAQETQALIALRMGQTDAARDIFRRLAQDVSAPDGVRNRANGLLAQLGG